MRLFHVFHDLKKHDLLFICQRKWEIADKLFHEVWVESYLECFSRGMLYFLIFPSQSEKLKMKEFLISEFSSCAVKVFRGAWTMKSEDIFHPCSESSTAADGVWYI